MARGPNGWGPASPAALLQSSAATTANAVAKYADTKGQLANSGVVIDASNNVTGFVALTISGNFSQTGATTFGTGTGIFTHNGSVSIVSGKTLTLADTTASTSTTTGALLNAGGFGNAGRISSASVVTGLSWTPGASSFTGNGISLGVGATAATQVGVLALEGDGTGGARYGLLSIRGKRSAQGDYGTASQANDVLAYIVPEGVGSTTGVLRYGGYIAATVESVQTTSVSARWDFFTVNSSGTDVQGLRLTSIGNVVLGKMAALATNATDGFVYVPTCAGTPTGVPTTQTGKVAIVVDTTNHKLYFYDAAWRDAGP